MLSCLCRPDKLARDGVPTFPSDAAACAEGRSGGLEALGRDNSDYTRLCMYNSDYAYICTTVTTCIHAYVCSLLINMDVLNIRLFFVCVCSFFLFCFFVRGGGFGPSLEISNNEIYFVSMIE